LPAAIDIDFVGPLNGRNAAVAITAENAAAFGRMLSGQNA